MKFNVLGPMEVLDDGLLLTPKAPKVRLTLALLLFRANRTVATEAIIDELWADRPPKSAVTTVQTYIYQLRKILAEASGSVGPQPALVTQTPGYVLRIDEDQFDVTVFERLVDEGRELSSRGRQSEASERLWAALRLWRGTALADVRPGPLLESHCTRLEEVRIGALQLRIRADHQLGDIATLLPELRSLVAMHPLNEWFHSELIGALAETGRRGEALQAYQSLRRILNEELGLEPSPPLQRLHRLLLDGDGTPRPECRSGPAELFGLPDLEKLSDPLLVRRPVGARAPM